MGAKKGKSKSPGRKTKKVQSSPISEKSSDAGKKLVEDGDQLPVNRRKPKGKKSVPAPAPDEKKSSESSSESSGEESPDERIQHSQKKRVKKVNPQADSSEEDSDGQSKGGSDESESESDDSSAEKAAKKPGKLFSDENVQWLKPKKEKLLSSDEEDDDDDEMVAVDNDESSDEEMEVERRSRLLDAEKKAEMEEVEDDIREHVSKHTSVYHLPTKEELDRDVDRVVPPSELRSHIEAILEVLADFKQRREPGRTRTEYIERLGYFMAEFFGYLPELIEYFLTMFSPAEALEFVEYSDKQRPMVIRTNTLKTRRKDLALALMKRGVSLDPLAAWSKVGLKIIESPVPIGATPEYLSGHYMLQSAASMCPVLALSPQPNERVLDMSAAPGGKTSYMAQLMRNTGVLFANDLRPDRQKATVANLHRLGVKNAVACTHDGRKLPKMFRHYRFDRVLLDAPCSGLGVISRDPSCKVQRTLADVQKTAHLQKELLLAAIDVLNPKSKTGGVMVYSTCSVSVFENEEVIQYALQKRDIKIVESGLDFGEPGFTRYQQKRFHPSIALSRRFYPHVHNMDGFYVCKIQKLSDKIPGETKPATADGAQVEDVPVADTEAPKEKVKSERAPKKGKKRTKSGSDDKKRDGPKKPKLEKPKVEKISIPPSKANQKSKKLNAKMTKPRRVRVEQFT